MKNKSKSKSESLIIIKSTIKSKTIFQRILFLILSFIFILKLLETLYPFEHGDALYYHLVGPKIWHEESLATMWKDLPLFVYAGAFDFLYIIPFYFFSSLLSIQLFAQAMHFLFSLGLASFFSYQKIHHPIWSSLAAMAILLISKDSAFFLYAKNDGVLAMMILITVMLLQKMMDQPRKEWNYLDFLLGLFLGIIPSLKMNGLFAVVPILFFYCKTYCRQSPKKIFILGLLIFITLLPTLIKNDLYIGNPFFPAMINRFPGIMSQRMMAHFHTFYGNPLTFDLVMGQFSDFLMGKVLFLLAPVFFLFNLLKNKNKNKQTPQSQSQSHLNIYFIISLSIFIFYLITNGSLRHPRYFFACYFLNGFFLFACLKDYFPNPPKKLVLLILFLILIDSKMDRSFSHLKAIFIDRQNLSEKEIVRKYIPLSGFHDPIFAERKKSHTTKKEFILSDVLSDSYYLPPKVRLHTAILIPSAGFLYDCSPMDVKKLKKYSYFIHDENLKLKNPCFDYLFEEKNRKFLLKIREYSLFKIY